MHLVKTMEHHFKEKVIGKSFFMNGCDETRHARHNTWA
jgi:hypothetical protein